MKILWISSTMMILKILWIRSILTKCKIQLILLPIPLNERLDISDAGNDVNDPLYAEVKQEPEVFLDDVDISELDALLQLGEVSSELFENFDDDVMIQKVKVYPKPIQTQYGINEDDTLCGNNPFRSYVSIMLSVRLQYFV